MMRGMLPRLHLSHAAAPGYYQRSLRDRHGSGPSEKDGRGFAVSETPVPEGPPDRGHHRIVFASGPRTVRLAALRRGGRMRPPLHKVKTLISGELPDWHPSDIHFQAMNIQFPNIDWEVDAVSSAFTRMSYDAILVVSFGGPEGPDDVIPFLENVLRGRNVPRERMLAVAKHYYHFDGKSPINQQTRDLIAAIKNELNQHGPNLPIYWGNRNWHPMLADTIRQMKQDGINSALAFVTSAYSSYSGCRQYRENIARAQAEVGEGAPQIDKLRVFFNHPGFLEATEDRLKEAFAHIPANARQSVQIVYVAHSVPMSM